MTSSTSNYKVSVTIPKQMGNKLFISPEPQSEKQIEKATIYAFDKESLKDKGITAAFGTHQAINFRLDYQLKNDNYKQVSRLQKLLIHSKSSHYIAAKFLVDSFSRRGLTLSHTQVYFIVRKFL